MPFAPGGNIDVLARSLSIPMGKLLGRRHDLRRPVRPGRHAAAGDRRTDHGAGAVGARPQLVATLAELGSYAKFGDAWTLSLHVQVEEALAINLVKEGRLKSD